MVIKHICISCSQSLLRGIKMKNSCTSFLFLSVCKLTNNKLLVHSPQIVYRRTEIDLMLGAALLHAMYQLKISQRPTGGSVQLQFKQGQFSNSTF